MPLTAAIDTRNVTGRRVVRYESYEELLADAERVAHSKTRTLGNWSEGQIFGHAALSLHAMLDGPPFGLPKPAQWLMRLVMLKRMTRETLWPGFQLPAKAAGMIPEPIETRAALELLRAAVARVRATDVRAVHGGFGRIRTEQWDAFQLRHCEMHMSFIVPNDSFVFTR